MISVHSSVKLRHSLSVKSCIEPSVDASRARTSCALLSKHGCQLRRSSLTRDTACWSARRGSPRLVAGDEACGRRLDGDEKLVKVVVAVEGRSSRGRPTSSIWRIRPLRSSNSSHTVDAARVDAVDSLSVPSPVILLRARTERNGDEFPRNCDRPCVESRSACMRWPRRGVSSLSEAA